MMLAVFIVWVLAALIVLLRYPEPFWVMIITLGAVLWWLSW